MIMIRLKTKHAKCLVRLRIKTVSYPSPGNVVGSGYVFLLESGISLGREMSPKVGAHSREPRGPQALYPASLKAVGQCALRHQEYDPCESSSFSFPTKGNLHALYFQVCRGDRAGLSCLSTYHHLPA